MLQSHKPRVIYKYQAIKPEYLPNLADRKLWASRPLDFNDPFEFRLQRVQKPRGLEQLRQQNPHFAHLADADLVRLAIAQYEKVRTMGVICFTKLPNNILMWSHYADRHRGLCLGFSIDKPLGELGIYPVEYSETYPPLTFLKRSGIDAAWGALYGQSTQVGGTSRNSDSFVLAAEDLSMLQVRLRKSSSVFAHLTPTRPSFGRHLRRTNLSSSYALITTICVTSYT